jgi:hypothetical protein
MAIVATVLCAFALPTRSATLGTCPDLVDDSTIHIASPADLAQTRIQLYEYVWGQASLPTNADVVVTPDVASPIGCSDGVLDHVDRLRIDMGPTATGDTVYGEAWHFVPATTPFVDRRNRLVIVHNGHMGPDACQGTLADGEDGLNVMPSRGYMGLQMTINALLADGYDVLAVLMPFFTEQQCNGNHGLLFTPGYTPPVGSGMRYFLDPTLRSLNHVLSQHAFEDVSMTGLSGGGWTTTVYAALDPRVKASFPVAGTIPLYLRLDAKTTAATDEFLNGILSGAPVDVPPTRTGCGNNLGDAEQYRADFYGIAGYLDLYVMGAYGPGREQVQILNRRDTCCFGQPQHPDPAAYDADLRDYERKVRTTLRRLGAGEFRVQVDEAATIHQISRDAVHRVILATLNRAAPKVGVASATSVAVRGTNGTLWHYAAHGWVDTGLPIAGTPAVLEGAIHSIDVVARGADNGPMHLYFDGAQWHVQALPVSADGTVLPRGKLVGDPVALSAAPGGFDVVALGPHSTVAPGTDFYHWRVTADGALLDRIASAPHAVGMPALAHVAPGRLGLYYRDGDQVRTDPAPVPPSATECVEQPRVPYALVQDPDQTWQAAERLAVSRSLLTFPAVATFDGNTRLFFVSEGGGMWAANLTAGAVETRLSDFVPPGLRFDGSPARPVPASGGFAFHARTRDGNLARFVHDGGGWSYTAIPLDDDPARIIIDSPRGLPDGVLWTGADGEIHRHDDAGFDILDRTFADGFDP